MLSYHADADLHTNPYELGLDRLVDLGMETDFIGKAALARGSGTAVQRYTPAETPETGDFDDYDTPSTAVPTVPVHDFTLGRAPTPSEKSVIRHLYRTYGSKNAIIRELWPTKNKNMCLQFIDAALTRQEVNA